MNTLIKLEEAALFILGIYLFTLLPLAWWYFPLLLLLPDFSMLGYVFNAKIGAICYNIFHHRGVAVIVYLLGSYLGNDVVQLCGIILFSHSAMDRMFGYGLKYESGFKYTHLGIIGKEKI